jgi:hypothetical protein
MEVSRVKPPPPRATILHVFSDRSILRKTTARDLCKIPIWHGNRILNEDHKKQIADHIEGLKSLDLKPFHLVTYPCEDETGVEEIKTFIVDGQHRVTILKEAFYANPETENFDVLIVEKACASQAEVTTYFKLLNTTRAIEWKEDPVMLAAPYVNIFEATFNKNKSKNNKLVRSGATKRPYMSLDKVREAIIKRIDVVTKRTPQEFIEYVVAKNAEWLGDARVHPNKDKNLERAILLEFILPQDDKFTWLVYK